MGKKANAWFNPFKVCGNYSHKSKKQLQLPPLISKAVKPRKEGENLLDSDWAVHHPAKVHLATTILHIMNAFVFSLHTEVFIQKQVHAQELCVQVSKYRAQINISQ